VLSFYSLLIPMPDISFITSCYNAEQFLDGLIENIRQQSLEDYEHIIVDSASMDNSLEIARGWEKQDDRIRVIAQDERTPYGLSWLTGWGVAGGKVVCNSNADDRSYPWRATQVLDAYNKSQFRSDARNFFYYGGYETHVNGIKTSQGIPPIYSEDDMSRFFRCGVHVHWDNELRHIIDWELICKAGREYRSAFDYWLVLYFMSLGAPGINIPSCFSIYNQRKDSIEQADKERNTLESLRAIETFYPEGQSAKDLNNRTRYDSPGFYRRYQEFKDEFV